MVHGKLFPKLGTFTYFRRPFEKSKVTCNDPEAGRSVLLDDEDVLSDPAPAVATAVLLNPTLSGIFFWRNSTKYVNRYPDEALTNCCFFFILSGLPHFNKGKISYVFNNLPGFFSVSKYDINSTTTALREIYYYQHTL